MCSIDVNIIYLMQIVNGHRVVKNLCKARMLNHWKTLDLIDLVQYLSSF